MSIDFGAGYVYVDEYDEISVLLINGKKQEKLPHDTPLGPFATDGSVTATGEFEYKGRPISLSRRRFKRPDLIS
ncbi:hypothetical protein FZC83_17285 [Rossellomorea marisflavi]|uniref:TcaA 4th domain-containing protein n=1 Tax=Rossellomorea marisflavi TaxID=189381 RepID=A0A5D4RPB5_9BACI|nr:hypothetical protein [Rossellomorea marisflavi]TYS52579.1 hypothetical protein FZC83_17285 [Rossellomorea marisflavi]